MEIQGPGCKLDQAPCGRISCKLCSFWRRPMIDSVSKKNTNRTAMKLMDRSAYRRQNAASQSIPRQIVIVWQENGRCGDWACVRRCLCRGCDGRNCGRDDGIWCRHSDCCCRLAAARGRRTAERSPAGENRGGHGAAADSGHDRQADECLDRASWKFQNLFRGVGATGVSITDRFGPVAAGGEPSRRGGPVGRVDEAPGDVR